jgi:simple sugar transport system permease protein
MIQRRPTPNNSPLFLTAATLLAIAAALAVAALLFADSGANPLTAYIALLHEPFFTLRGFGYALVRATPLTLIALGTIVAWRSGFTYLGFEGCFVLGAASTAWLALSTHLPPSLFFPAALLLSFATGAAWAGLTGLLRARFGGNEVLISLMSNYVAILIVKYLVSGPMRAPGSLPETDQLPHPTWLPFILPGTRAHAGILIAISAAAVVWLLLKKLPLGFELVVTGLNPSAARYAGIHVRSRILISALISGGLGALAGLTELLGAQHRLMDGISGGVGFTGVIVALLARLNPLAVLPTALLYGGMTVGADAMQRRAGIPSSITFILQSLIVLFILASTLLRHYEFNRTQPPPLIPNP